MKCWIDDYSCWIGDIQVYHRQLSRDPQIVHVRYDFDWDYPTLHQSSADLGLKKKLFDWRNPTDPIFTADPKYFYFFVCKKKFKKPRKTNIFI